MKSPGTEMFAT